VKSDEQAPRDPAKSGATPYMTAAQVAELLQVSSKSIYRIASEDASFPALRLVAGGSWRVHRDQLQRWLDQRTQGARRRSA
jgi:excisionase family DNA binding protein